MNITTQSILITGAGSGIGRATAIALARKGARLTLFGRVRNLSRRRLGWYGKPAVKPTL
jgi:NAD(P)-dependent dehydrogenase (short-subunit alcohol dehydrogenase family)